MSLRGCRGARVDSEQLLQSWLAWEAGRPEVERRLIQRAFVSLRRGLPVTISDLAREMEVPFRQTYPKLREGSVGADFLLRRGWFHSGEMTVARAFPSTGRDRGTHGVVGEERELGDQSLRHVRL